MIEFNKQSDYTLQEEFLNLSKETSEFASGLEQGWRALQESLDSTSTSHKGSIDASYKNPNPQSPLSTGPGTNSNNSRESLRAGVAKKIYGKGQAKCEDVAQTYRDTLYRKSFDVIKNEYEIAWFFDRLRGLVDQELDAELISYLG